MFIPENQLRAPTPVTSRPTCGSDDEDWEAEANVKVSYNPAEAAAKKNVLRKIEGAAPSQRKAFRMKEFERLKELDKNEDTSESSDTEEIEDLDKTDIVRGKGKGILLIKLRKLRKTSQELHGGLGQTSTAKNNNNMKRRGVALNPDLENPGFSPVSAKRIVSKGRGRIRWQSSI